MLLSAEAFEECPSLCKCDMFAGLRRAKCVNKILTSIEAGVPSEVQSLDLSSNMISSLENHAFAVVALHFYVCSIFCIYFCSAL